MGKQINTKTTTRVSSETQDAYMHSVEATILFPPRPSPEGCGKHSGPPRYHGTVTHCSTAQSTGRNPARNVSPKGKICCVSSHCERLTLQQHFHKDTCKMGLSDSDLILLLNICIIKHRDGFPQTRSNSWHTGVTQMFTEETKGKAFGFKRHLVGNWRGGSVLKTTGRSSSNSGLHSQQPRHNCLELQFQVSQHPHTDTYMQAKQPYNKITKNEKDSWWRAGLERWLSS